MLTLISVFGIVSSIAVLTGCCFIRVVVGA